MSTLAIVRALLRLIQGEANPVYRATLNRVKRRPFNAGRWSGALLFFLMGSFVVLRLLEQQLGLQFVMYRSVTLFGIVTVGASLLGLSWTVPLASLAGQGIMGERIAQTWDVLRVTPMPRETILLAQAAAGVRRVWGIATSMAILMTCMGAIVGGVLIYQRDTTQPALGVVLMVVGIGAVILERLQEIALAVVIGLAAALQTESRRTALLIGLSGGVLIRVIQLFIVVKIMPPPATLDPNLTLIFSPGFTFVSWFILNAFVGSALLLTSAPVVPALLILGAMMAARELLTRALFAWAVRRDAF